MINDQKNPTEMIFGKIEEFFDDKAFYENIRQGNTDALKSLLETTVKESSLFSDYLYRLIFYSSDLQKDNDDYSAISDDEYYKRIQRSFEDNGMKNRGSLQPEKTTRLSHKKDVLEKRSVLVSREDVFLFALGLNLDERTTELLLTKALLQHSFNPKDYREVIIYYCLKNKEGGSSYRQYTHWMKRYEELSTPVIQDSIDSDTLLLRKKVFSIKNEAELIRYLTELKSVKEDALNLRSARNEYISLFHQLPHSEEMLDEYDQNFNRLKEYVRKVEETRREQTEEELVDGFWHDYHEHSIAAKSFVQHLNELKKDAKNIIEDEELLDIEVLKMIFDGYSVTMNSYYNRESGRVSVSRKDLLFLSYMVYAAEFQETERERNLINMFREPEERDEDRWDRYYYNYVSTWSLICNRCGFYYDLYVRNPFELFIIYCSLQKKPFDYFLASWAKAEK